MSCSTLYPLGCHREINKLYRRLRGKSIGKLSSLKIRNQWVRIVESLGRETVIREAERWIRSETSKKWAHSNKNAIEHLIHHLSKLVGNDGKSTSSPRDHAIKLYFKSHEDYRNAVEKIGMCKAIEHEILHGRIPKDVSDRFLGYDIESNGRRIEVKASNWPIDKAKIYITPNELYTLIELGNQYYIYLTVEALTKTKSHLYTIKNPSRFADRFKVGWDLDKLTGKHNTIYILYPEDYIQFAIDSDLDTYYEDINSSTDSFSWAHK